MLENPYRLIRCYINTFKDNQQETLKLQSYGLSSANGRRFNVAVQVKAKTKTKALRIRRRFLK